MFARNAFRLCALIALTAMLAPAQSPVHAASATPGSVQAPPDSSLLHTLPDSLRNVTLLPVVVVAAPPLRRRAADAGLSVLGEERLRDRPGAALAALGPLLPSTQVNVNSRGEALFMVRGAPERQLGVFLDGIPLALPWDERADLSILPADAVAELRATRGVASVLVGPGALAGTLRVIPREAPANGSLSELWAQAGESEALAGGVLHGRAQGPWRLLASYSRRARGAWLLPADYEAPFHQGAGRARTNSRLEQDALLLRGGRDWDVGAELRLTLLGLAGSRGVPPETHVDIARFWRYPEQRRGIAGLALSLPLGEKRRWRLRTQLAADLFGQEIRRYDNAGYDSPPLAPGVEHEIDRDRSLHARAGLRRALGESAGLGLLAAVRHTLHRESLEYEGPEERYSQLLSSLACELDVSPNEDWQLRFGTGWERAATPLTGDKPERDPTDVGLFLLRVERRPHGGARIHAALSRRSRFPSLRELYSGALGKFELNPELAPERQDLAELGLSRAGRRHELGVTAFVSRLRGGIEKQTLPGEVGRFRRVNAQEIRSLGLELAAVWRPRRGLVLSARHTQLDARRLEGEGLDSPAEDRAEYVSSLDLTWTSAFGLRLRCEGRLLGARHSADASEEEDGLSRLPAQSSWNLRVAWLLPIRTGRATDAEIYLRADNVFDQRSRAQAGLPAPGRMLHAGLRLRLGGES